MHSHDFKRHVNNGKNILCTLDGCSRYVLSTPHMIASIYNGFDTSGESRRVMSAEVHMCGWDEQICFLNWGCSNKWAGPSGVHKSATSPVYTAEASQIFLSARQGRSTVMCNAWKASIDTRGDVVM